MLWKVFRTPKMDSDECMIWWCLLWIPTSQICLHFAFSVCAFLDFFSMISALGLTGKSSSGNQEVWLVVKAQWLSYLNDLVISTLNLEFLDCLLLLLFNGLVWGHFLNYFSVVSSWVLWCGMAVEGSNHLLAFIHLPYARFQMSFISWCCWLKIESINYYAFLLKPWIRIWLQINLMS